MKWLNIATNLVYTIAGYFGDWITFSAGLLLCIGSGLMHYQEEYGERKEWAILLDWFGMYAFTLSIFALLTNPYVLLLLIPIGLLRNEMRDHNLIGMLVLLLIAVSMSWKALILFAVAFAIRQKWENTEWQDYSHSAWHLITGLAYYLILSLA